MYRHQSSDGGACMEELHAFSSCEHFVTRAHNKWARVTKCSQLLNIPIEMPGDTKEERRGTSWARATRELRRLRHRIEAVGGSKDQWEAGVWHMDKEQWDLLWTGEQAFWKTVPHLDETKRKQIRSRHPVSVIETEEQSRDTHCGYSIETRCVSTSLRKDKESYGPP
jgi:hypothetical protein